MEDGVTAALSSRTRWLLSCGAAVGPVFVTTFLVDGSWRAGYLHHRHPVSSLALGPGGWRQMANFAVAGGLCLGFAAGLSQTDLSQIGDGQPQSALAPILIACAGLGLLGAGTFVTDPFNGYPPGTPNTPNALSRSGQLHDLSAALILVSMPAAQLLYAWRFARASNRGWAAYSAGSAMTMIASSAVARAGFHQVPQVVDRAGFFQRTAVIAGFGWGSALAARYLRTGDRRRERRRYLDR
jgi:hypothetical protein